MFSWELLIDTLDLTEANWVTGVSDMEWSSGSHGRAMGGDYSDYSD